MKKLPSPLVRLVTGGQTGVDRACLDFALAQNIACGGWCPKGRLAEDGTIDSKYALTETTSDDVAVRTELNVRDSDGTLIISFLPLEGGTAWTLDCAKKYGKPTFVVSLDEYTQTSSDIIQSFHSWIAGKLNSCPQCSGTSREF